MTKLTCKVWNSAFTTLLTTDPGAASSLSESDSRRIKKEFNDVGAGSLRIQKDSTQASVLSSRRIVQWLLDGTAVFATLVEPEEQDTVPADPGTDDQALRTVSGRGTLAVFERAAVYPAIGVGKRNSPDHRIFGPADPNFDDSGWSSASQIKQQSATSPAQWTYTDENGATQQAPKGWPSQLASAYWIWSQAQGGGSPPQPIGTVHLRYEFNVATATDARIFISADDGFRLFIDGALVAEETRAFMWADTRYVDYYFDSGDHTVYIEAINITRPNAATNIAGVVAGAVATSNGGSVLGSVIFQTSSSWKALGYPASPPGMTPGQIIRLLISEAQARGGLSGVTTTFTNASDTASVAWTEIGISFPVGTSLLDVIRALVEVHDVDVEMSATSLALSAWKTGGTDLSGTVSLVKGTHLLALHHSTKPATLTVGVTRDVYGRYLETADAAAVTATDRIEGFLSVGAMSDEGATANVQAQFVSRATDAILYAARVEPAAGVVPLVGFDVADTIKLPNRALTATNVRVMSVEVTTNADADAFFEVVAI